MTNKQDELVEVQAEFTIPYTMIENDVMDSLAFDQGIDKLVYISLLRFAFQKGVAFPSLRKLAFMCCCTSLNTIRTSIKRLDAMGLVKVEYRKKGNQDNDTNLYRIFPLSKEHKVNSVSNPKAFAEAVKEDKERKAEKAEKKRKSDSKNDLVQNLKEGSSKFEGASSNFEPKEKELNKKVLRKSSEEEEDIATANNFIESLKSQYNQVSEIFWIKMWHKYKKGNVTNFESYVLECLDKELKKIEREQKKQDKQLEQPKQQSSGKKATTRKEQLPEWLEEQKQQKAQQPDQQPETIDLEEERRRLEEELKMYKKKA